MTQRKNTFNIEQIKEHFNGCVPSDREEIFKDIISSLEDYDVLSIYNDGYCSYYPDNYIYDNDEFTINDLMCGKSPFDILNEASGGYWKSYHDYFHFDGYGDMVSFDDIFTVIDLDELAEFCVRNPSEIEKYVDEDDIRLAFAYYAEELTDEEIEGVDVSTLIEEDWDDIVDDIVWKRGDEDEDEADEEEISKCE
jgi:hypothetical protein